jgi:acetyl esterase
MNPLLQALRARIEHGAVTSLRMAPRAIRERLSVPSRGYEGDRLDDDLRLMLGLQARAGLPPWDSLPLSAARALFDRTGTLLAPRAAPLERVDEVSLDGPVGAIPARMYRPFGLPASAKTLVYFHGGGFVLGSVASYDPVCRMLAATAGCAVLSVDYRLAPEHRWPAAVHDATAAFRQTLVRADSLGVDPRRVAVGGDSAGGYLAAQVAWETRADPEAERPILQLLIYPAVDFTMASASIDALGDGLLLERRSMQWFLDHFVPEGMDRADPALSPAFRSVEALAGQCPAHVQTAGFDPLRDEGIAYARKLAEAGVTVEHKHYGGLVHGYLNITEACPAALSPYFDAASALRRAFASVR